MRLMLARVRSVYILAALALLLALVSTACGSSAPAPTPAAAKPAAPAATTAPAAPAATTAPAAAAAAPTTAAPAASAQLTPLQFRLNWTLYGEHAFFYAALEKGFYKEQGLDVKINEGSGSGNVLKQVAAGSDPIGYVDTPTLLKGLAEGVPVKSVLVVQQRGPSSIIYRMDTPIKTPADLKGKKIAFTAGDSFSAIFPALLAANNLKDTDMTIVSLPTPAAKETGLLQKQIDGFGGFYNDQPLRMMDREKEAKLGWMPFFDFGVNVLGTGIVVNEQYLKDKPDLVKKFLAGVVKGMDYEKANPQDAAQIFSKYAPEFHPALAKQEIDQTIPLLQTENTKGKPTGVMSEKDWQNTYDLLVKYTGLKGGMTPSSFFTNDYLPAK